MRSGGAAARSLPIAAPLRSPARAPLLVARYHRAQPPPMSPECAAELSSDDVGLNSGSESAPPRHHHLSPAPTPSSGIGSGGTERAVGGRHASVHQRKGNTTFLALLFVAAIGALAYLFLQLPPLTPSQRERVKFPRSFDDVLQLNAVLSVYRDQSTQHYWAVVAGFCGVYIFLQTFAIPGAIFLSVLAGPLFGVWQGLFIVSLTFVAVMFGQVATSGASLCYTLSRVLGRSLVERCLPDLLARFRSMIEHHHHNLFFYLLFLRVSPLLPNWFINVASPILDVPLPLFCAATFFGLMPANYLHVNTGVALSTVTTHEGGINWRSLLLLLVIACLALVPTLFRKKIEQIDKSTEEKRT